MVLFIDLDDTLYPSNSGMWQAIMERIDRYMIEIMQFPVCDVQRIRGHLFHKYGTTLRGLQMEYKVDTLDYLKYVHDVPLHRYIQPDPKIKKALSLINERKIIFTNADVRHARRVLDVLELAGHFDDIIDIVAITPYCKPQREAFEMAMSIAGINDVSECILVDDAVNNINTASGLGFKTIKVGKNGDGCLSDFTISSAEFLPEAYNYITEAKKA